MRYIKTRGYLLGVVMVISLLVLCDCGKRKRRHPSPGTRAAEAVSEDETAGIRLRQSKSGSVLILEEKTEVKTAKGEPSRKDAGLSDRPVAPLPSGYKAFRDQHVRLYVKDVPAGLKDAVMVAQAASGQLINYPIKGFKNMGPNEKTLVFDARTYPVFIKKLETLGKVEQPEVGPSDFITVRLTVLAQE